MAEPRELAALTDREVVVLARDGREAAYRELDPSLRTTSVFPLVLRMVRDRQLAEDLSQKPSSRPSTRSGQYRPEYKFSSWIFKIANNAAIDHLRRRELDTLSLDGAPHAATPEEVEATALQVGDDGETPLEELEARGTGQRDRACHRATQTEYRACILLRHVEGLAYEEIAQSLDLPLGTVKTYIHRARHELRDLLAPPETVKPMSTAPP